MAQECELDPPQLSTAFWPWSLYRPGLVPKSADVVHSLFQSLLYQGKMSFIHVSLQIVLNLGCVIFAHVNGTLVPKQSLVLSSACQCKVLPEQPDGCNLPMTHEQHRAL